jgi:hypothetical protein
VKTNFDHKLAKNLLRPWKLRLWMFHHLPMGLASGMYIKTLNESGCTVVLKDRPWIRNPFGSVFWAVMGMAGELSTGALVYSWCSGYNIKFILVHMEGTYLKKLSGKSSYFCSSGQDVLRSLELLENPGDISSVVMPVIAHDQAGQKVAEFQFTWSLKNTG